MSEKTDLLALAILREPFAENQIGKLPKPYNKDAQKGQCRECGGYHGLPAMHLDYVGHAALTDRFLDVDPEWTWEPVALDAAGLPAFDKNGGLWIRLTICGVTRLGYGDAQGKQGGNAVKEAIGDALRNAGMRFGAALDLWHKGDLRAEREDEPDEPFDTTEWEAAIAAATNQDELASVGARLLHVTMPTTARSVLQAAYRERAGELVERPVQDTELPLTGDAA